MFFKKKYSSCSAKNPKDAVVCASCGTPFETKPPEGQTAIKDYDETVPQQPQDAQAKSGFEKGGTRDSASGKAKPVGRG